MSVITVYAVISQNDQDEYANMSEWERRAVVRNIERLEDLFRHEDLRNLTATLTDAVDENGVKYESFEFVPSVRYVMGGDVWLSGGGFRFNASAHVRETRKSLSV